MKFSTLAEWLRWQEQLHPNRIDMGLERVRQVLQAMDLATPPYRILTVGGTNGKGSCVTLLDAICRAQGYRTGAYLSPHLLRYNERVTLDGAQAGDQEFCAAFERVDAARAGISLTYFEFGTLAALEIFRRHRVEVALLEVGMGGRLDAVNGVDSLGALVVSIGLDHMEWLGPDRDSIGYEKAGIYRRDRPAICGDCDPPPRLLKTAAEKGARLQVLGRDFDWQKSPGGWTWHAAAARIENLPAPALPGHIQFDNTASVIALLRSMRNVLEIGDEAIRTGLRRAHLAARFERVPGAVEIVYDIAHNPAAAHVLAANLAASRGSGRTLAVFGMFRDKDAEGVVREVAPQVDGWFVGGLTGPRGQSGEALLARLHKAAPEAPARAQASIADAWRDACTGAVRGDRIVVFGSFHTVADVLRAQQESGTNAERAAGP